MIISSILTKEATIILLIQEIGANELSISLKRRRKQTSFLR